MTRYYWTKGGLIATGEARNLKHLITISNKLNFKELSKMTKGTKYKSFTEQYGSDEFYPDVPQLDIASIIGKPYVIGDAKIVEDFDGKFGTHDFAILLIVDTETGDKLGTVITSGQVVLKKIRKALSENMLPLVGTLVREQRYYNLI